MSAGPSKTPLATDLSLPRTIIALGHLEHRHAVNAKLVGAQVVLTVVRGEVSAETRAHIIDVLLRDGIRASFTKDTEAKA
ncbi:MAG: hypothetical protein PHW10_02645 [Candidatus Peribacteraceae bacterium]|nr:hypothetical protein [Candidatus Peribacteraceae bacterium]